MNNSPKLILPPETVQWLRLSLPVHFQHRNYVFDPW